MSETRKTGGELIVDALKANGVRRIACVPGESASNAKCRESTTIPERGPTRTDMAQILAPSAATMASFSRFVINPSSCIGRGSYHRNAVLEG